MAAASGRNVLIDCCAAGLVFGDKSVDTESDFTGSGLESLFISALALVAEVFARWETFVLFAGRLHVFESFGEKEV
jgi:hypothetical protein